MPATLGRTNKVFPQTWLRLTLDESNHHSNGVLADALAKETVLDISVSPALWGNLLRGKEVKLMTRGGIEIAQAPDEKTASDLLEAHMIQTLSALGREAIDFYFLTVRSALEEFQISGALRALESARQEGHVGHIGLSSEGPPMATLALWQFHDAFEVLLLDRPDEALMSLARERRVGIVTAFPSEETQLARWTVSPDEGSV